MNKLTLDRILQSQGFGSRKQCRKLIENEAVSIAGEIFSDTKTAIETDGLEFTIFDQQYTYRKHLYIALNKPADFECTRNPSHNRSILNILPPEFIRRNIQPVGRLDNDTTGLLLFSDDGAFIHTQSSPKRQIQKVYVVKTFDPVTSELIELLLNGVQLHREPALLAAKTCRKLDEHHLEIVVEQGKYHQIKRMVVAAGNHCTSLNRSQIGNLKLETLGLKAGEWCYLDEPKLALLAT